VACYVDVLKSYPDAGLRFTEFCHLLADERAELHAMADRIGMPRRFFQDHPWRWHYDLPAHLRELALSHGAREIATPAVGALLRQRRLAARSTPARPTGATAAPVALGTVNPCE
jgi:Protein of unknown function (DUF4031)